MPHESFHYHSHCRHHHHRHRYIYRTYRIIDSVTEVDYENVVK